MGYAILLILLAATAVGALRKPAIGAYAYFLMSIMAPQSIWFWVFEGIPAFSMVAGVTILALIFSIVFRKLDLSIYNTKQNYLLIIFWAMFNLSDMFSPIGDFTALTGAELVLDTFNIIVLMYFVTLPLLYSEQAIRNMMFVFIGMIAYYVYWANMQYFTYNFKQFGHNGRLHGPIYGPYRDQNVFATIFTVGMPFLLFGLFYFKQTLLRVFLGIVLLFLWHSTFLTGSRGGLLSLGLATLIAYPLLKSRALGFLLICGFVVAVIFQGGQLLERATNTIDIAQSGTEERIDPRLQSWEVGINLIQKFPLLGVGVQRFQQATRVYFPDRPAYVAHNTFLNFAANSGLVNGLIYLYFYWLQFKRFRDIRRYERDPKSFFCFANNSIMVSLTGFYIGAMFLDLIVFESYYFLLLMGLLLHQVYFKKYRPQQLASVDNATPRPA